MNRSASCQLSQLELVLLQVSVVILFLAAATGQQPSHTQPITLPGCPDKCGDISIPFPFGVKPGCFLDGFQVTCNYSFQPPRLFLFYDAAGNKSFHLAEVAQYSGMYHSESLENITARPIELIDISIAQSEARAYGAIRSSCFSLTNSSNQIRRLQATNLAGPFILAAKRNVLIGVGWSVIVYMVPSLFTTSATYQSCLSDTNLNPDQAINGLCSGLGCCQAPVAHPRTYYGVVFLYNWERGGSGMHMETNPCSYGMLVESSWYNFSVEDIYGRDVLTKKYPRGVPFVIDFAIRNRRSCPVPGGPAPPDYACRSSNSYCANATNGPGYVCKCSEHYHGNPYIPNGCQDIDECALRRRYPELRKDYPCSSNGICANRLGGYDCPCKHGMNGDGKAGTCTDQFPLTAKVAVGKRSFNIEPKDEIDATNIFGSSWNVMGDGYWHVGDSAREVFFRVK